MNRLRTLFQYILLAVVSLITFGNTLSNGFVYDDASVIAQNPRVHTLANIRYVFSPLYFKLVGKGKEHAFGEASYRPVVTLTYFFDALVFNGSAFGCHLTNLLLHIANVLLLCIVLQWIFGARIPALFASILFALHPVVTESVNAIGFREDLLVVFFLLFGLLLFRVQRRRGDAKPSLHLELLHALCFALALFSKESAVIYPVLLAGLMYVSDIQLKRYIRLFVLLIGTLMFYMLIRFQVMVDPVTTPLVYPGGSMVANFYTMVKVFGGYIGSILYPIELLADHHVEPERELSLQILANIVLITAIFVLAAYGTIRKTIWGYGLLWFFVCLIPVSNLIKIVNISAERYLYLPLIGACIAGAVLLFAVYYRYKKFILVLLVVLVTVYSCRSAARNADWADTPSLWQATLQVEPKSHRALSNLATYFFEHGDYRDAIRYYLRALGVRTSATDRYNLANCYVRIGDFVQAEREYRKALAVDPEHPEIYNNLALLLVKMQRFNEAKNVLNKMLLYKSADAGYFENMGLIYDAQGEYGLAVEQYRKVLELNPDSSSAYNKLAVTYFKKGDTERAILLLEQGLEAFPENVNLYKNLALMYRDTGNYKRELYYWQRAYKLDPNDRQLILQINDTRNRLKVNATNDTSKESGRYKDQP